MTRKATEEGERKSAEERRAKSERKVLGIDIYQKQRSRYRFGCERKEK